MPPIRDPLGTPGARSSGIRDDVPLSRLAAVIFDMDGVITDTATLHLAAWKMTFDAYLVRRASLEVAQSDGQAADGAHPPGGQVTRIEGSDRFRPFEEDDYRRHVDGKPREAGVRDFLASRGLALPEGRPDDPAGFESVVALGRLKNQAFLDRTAAEGIEPVATSVEFVDRLLAAGRHVAVISASENATQVLEAAGVLSRFAVKVDGLDARRMHLPGKPDPAIFLEAARRLGESPAHVGIVEDALAGVEAGARGRFTFVLAIDRAGYGRELAAAGATLVVRDLGELLEPRARGSG